MPMEYTIDPERRLVHAMGKGVITDKDLFDYQREVWSRNDVAGFHELVDVSGVERVLLPSLERMMELATLSAQMDDHSCKSKLAIVAQGELAGLGRAYATYRGLEKQSGKEVVVFATLEEALDWIEGKDGTGQ